MLPTSEHCAQLNADCKLDTLCEACFVQNSPYPLQVKDAIVNIELFRDLSDIKSLSTSSKAAILALACTRIHNNVEKLFSSCVELTHFINVIDTLSNELKLNHHRQSAAACGVKKLVRNFDAAQKKSLPAAEISPSEANFRARALAFIKQRECHTTPTKLLHSALYHSAALAEGIKILSSMLNQPNSEATLLKFTNNYCYDHLQPGQFLLRPSSSALPGSNQPFVFTVTYKNEKGMFNVRRVCKENEGETAWGKIDEPTKYLSFEHLTQEFIDIGLQPVPAPGKENVDAYVRSKYIG